MPELIVRVIGDTSSLEKSYKRAAAGTKTFSKEVEGAGRGALVATGAFKGLGRSIAFASAGFIGFASAGEFLRQSIEVATDAAVAQRALAAQMKASGESFAANQQQIEKAGLSLSRFGFTSEDAEKALTVLERGTGNITQSIQLLGLTADLARAKNLDFAAAANIVAKVFGGQTTALRRAVPGLEKNAEGWDLIREAQKRLAGQAQAGTTPQEKFAAAIHDTQLSIGNALLPTVNEYLGKATVWLSNTKHQKELTDELTTSVGALGTAVGIATGLLGKYDDALGKLREGSKSSLPLTRGISDTLRLLVDPGYGLGKAAELYDKLSAAISGTGDASKKAAANMDLFGPFTSAANQIRTAAAAVGNQVGAAPGEVPSRIGADILRRQKAPVPGAATRAAGQRDQWFDAGLARMLDRVQDIGTIKGQIAKLKTIGGLIQQRINATKDVTRKLSLEDQLVQVQRQIRGDQATLGQNAAQAAADAKARRAQITQNMIDALQLNVDKAGLTKSLQDDLAAARRLEQYLRELIRTRGSTLDLQKQLLGAEQQTAGIQQQIAANRKAAAAAAKQAADAAKAAAQQAAADARTAAQTRQFRALGLGAGGEDLPPGLAALRNEFKRVGDAIKGTFLDTKTNRGLFAGIRRDLSGNLGQLGNDVKAKIKEILDGIDQQLGQHANSPRFRRLTGQQFVDALGLNLTTAQRRRIEAAVAGMGPGGSVPQPSGQFTAGRGGGVVITGPVHIHGVQNIAELENQLTKRAKARAHTRRGA